MSNEVQKFDPSTLMQGVKDRIKATFVSLVPDDQWDQMVQKEIDAFFNVEQDLNFIEVNDYKDSYWNPKRSYPIVTKMTPFRQLVWGLCADKTMALLRQKATDEWFGNHWPLTEESVSDQMKRAIKEAAPAAMLTFFERVSFIQMEQLRNHINNIR